MNITPVILTLNEEPNIEATLSSLAWAREIVVVDSGSSDRTAEIARSFAGVRWFARKFDSHAEQWSFGFHGTDIDTRYVLALDADMRPGPGFVEELARFTELAVQTRVLDCQVAPGAGHSPAGRPGSALPEGTGAGRRPVQAALVPFEYRVQGRPLLGSIYPAQIRVFEKDTVEIAQRGHTQVFRSAAPPYRFRSKLIHEDRKPFSRWVVNQLQYASLEAERIRTAPAQSFRDRLRRVGISPAIWGAYAYLRAGGPFKGRASRAYAEERVVFEALLARLLAGPEPASRIPS